MGQQCRQTMLSELEHTTGYKYQNNVHAARETAVYAKTS